MLHQELTEAALFLLEHPPLDEIGGDIVDVIERYRYKVISKKQAEQQMLEEHYPCLSRYIQNKELVVF